MPASTAAAITTATLAAALAAAAKPAATIAASLATAAKPASRRRHHPRIPNHT